jgi:hypothetical protein
VFLAVTPPVDAHGRAGLYQQDISRDLRDHTRCKANA